MSGWDGVSGELRRKRCAEGRGRIKGGRVWEKRSEDGGDGERGAEDGAEWDVVGVGGFSFDVGSQGVRHQWNRSRGRLGEVQQRVCLNL
jgi:hypothetical protein